MKLEVGQQVEMKKKHPCGNKIFKILRIGMDIKIRCEKCHHEIMSPRGKVEKNIKKILDNSGEKYV